MTNDNSVRSTIGSFWALARESPAGVVVTVFPTRDARYRARVEADGHGFYTSDYDSISELFAKLSEEARQ